MAKKKGGKTTGGDATELDDLAQSLGGGAGSDEAGEGDAEAGGENLDKDETVARLKACAARLAKPNTFVKGQLVQWKKGLKNKRTPAYGDPVVVIETLAQPLFDQQANSAGSPYFREPLTLVAGELDGEGDLLCFYYDGRRFEPYSG